jgi:hypothetical protein
MAVTAPELLLRDGQSSASGVRRSRCSAASAGEAAQFCEASCAHDGAASQSLSLLRGRKTVIRG